MKLLVFDSSYFPVKGNFEDDGTESYLVFQIVYTFKSLIIAFIILRGNDRTV